MENGVDTKSIITISVYPAEEGFVCTITEPNKMPLTADYSIALTIAHGMVKMALDRPDLVFDEGVDAMSNPSHNKLIDMNDIIINKKRKLH